MREKQFRNGRSCKAQMVTCFLATEPEKLPSEKQSQWYDYTTAFNDLQVTSLGTRYIPNAHSRSYPLPPESIQAISQSVSMVTTSLPVNSSSETFLQCNQSSSILIKLCPYFYSKEVYDVCDVEWLKKIEEEVTKRCERYY